MGTTGRTRHVPPPTFDLIEDECTLNAAAAREVSRELDVLNFSPSPSPMTQTDSCDSVRAHPAADVAAAVLVRAPAQVTAIEAVLASAATKAVLASADAVLPACMTIASKEKEAAGCSRPILHRRRPIGRPSPHHPSHPLLVYASRLHSLFPGAGYRPHNEDQDAAPSPAVSAVVSAGARLPARATSTRSECRRLRPTPHSHTHDSQIDRTRTARPLARTSRNAAYTIATGASTPSPPPTCLHTAPRDPHAPQSLAYNTAYTPTNSDLRSVTKRTSRDERSRGRKKRKTKKGHTEMHRDIVVGEFRVEGVVCRAREPVHDSLSSQPPLIPSLAPFTRKQTPDTVPVQQSNTSASAPGSTVSQSPAQLAPSAPGHHTTPLWTISPAPLVADGSPLPVAP
ncbi:hypothetical protein K438DRAFT_1762342 [Mycena galopus ATCC 62051]|nr:hypothetical protein K438DRAFT_1762342 [Mycena galopus ATCC 62051]